MESARIVGSNSTQIVHDSTMAGFMSGSRIAQSALEEAQQKRLEREAAVSTIKNVLGIFSSGRYLGYLGALSMPIGFSFGGINEGVGFFMETGFSPPAFEGHERQSTLSDNGNSVQNQAQEFTYTKIENKETTFLWDLVVGFNINIIKTLLWANIGAGFEYRQDYELFTETSVDDSNNKNEIWIQNESDEKLKLVMENVFIKLQDYNDDDEIEMMTNTYFVRNAKYFIGCRDGYFDLQNFEVKEKI